ncbi:hypothetical protein GBA52_029009 [Prunus armeniaca]|nr:hypothetical protein GBA52_029009 [Prunus armeniaca]
MDKPANTVETHDSESVISSLQDLSFKNSFSISMCSSTVSVSDNSVSSSTKVSNGTQEANKNSENAESSIVDCEDDSDKSTLCQAGNSSRFDPNDGSFRSFCPSKPHKGNDMRWDAIQCVKAKDGDLGLGHFRLLKKLGCGDIGSVYLAELRGLGCLFRHEGNGQRHVGWEEEADKSSD